jgi:beta-phosphoglucomutase family hydrolase
MSSHPDSPHVRSMPGVLHIEHVDAVVFDLDGVITDTARLHAEAWQHAFDELLRAQSGDASRDIVPFDIDRDYRLLVDGRPRFDGAQAFLTARGIDLPPGMPVDPAGRDTVWAIASLKNEAFHRLVGERGVHVFASAVTLLGQLRAAGVRTAVVTASRNAEEILHAAGVSELFDCRVDGNDAAALDLPGKPDPATYLEALRRLNVSPDRAVVVEDAIAGVAAGRRGDFGLVVGVDRGGNGSALTEAGADVVVADLGDLPLDLVRLHELPGLIRDGKDFCGGGEPSTDWILCYDGYDARREGLREALCTTGNGYLGTRGAAPECQADGVHYPGTYLAGVYNRLVTAMDDRSIEHEHLVNAPNWLPLRFRIEDGEWFSPDAADLQDYRQELDLRTGVLTRRLRFRDAVGRHTRVEQHRFVHMGNQHLAALETSFTAEDWSGRLEVQAGIDGKVSNSNLAEDAPLAKVHLAAESAAVMDPEVISLTMATVQSRIRIAVAARVRIHDAAGHRVEVSRQPEIDEAGYSGQRFVINVVPQRTVTVEKVVAVATSRDPAISEPAQAVCTEVTNAGDFFQLRLSHERVWARLWERFDLAIEASDDVILGLRLHTFHLLQTLSEHTAQLDAGIPARGLHGEGYHGHVFWDAMFAFPTLNLRLPAVSRALILYRWRRLPAARRAARAAGHPGAMFPWESGSEGREETPQALFDPGTRQWFANHSQLQRHIGTSLVYDIWQYYQVTGDINFLVDYGAELVIEIARYLASLTTYDPADGRYGIAGVVGPDEYHDTDPETNAPGVRDNAYTNVMTAWVLQRALELIALLAGHHCGQLWEQLGISEAETALWDHISRRMLVPFHDGVISQFAGYERLAEFDWERYRAEHPDFVGIDAVLRAQGDDPNRYKLSKQADVLMLFYLLSAEELRETFDRLGYELTSDTVERTVAYYLARVAHGSSLSRIAHSWVEARANRERSWKLFTEAVQGDLADIRGGSTHTGIHLGAMAGTIDLVQRCYTGLETRANTLYLHPQLPAELHALHAEILYRGQWVVIDVNHRRLRVGLRPCQASPIKINVDGIDHVLKAGQQRRFNTDRPRPR